jgi:hypothetical protein
VIAVTFPRAGTYQVGLRVVDSKGAAASTTETITVAAPTSANGGPSGSGGAQGGGGTQGHSPTVRSYSLMSPFPIVRMAGRLTRFGVKVRVLSIRGPRNVKIVARCKGRGCPFHRKKLKPGLAGTKKRASVVVRLRALERRLPAGVVLSVYVTSRDAIGKYTRFKIRRGKPPARADRCMLPAVSRPVRCPM